MFNSRNFGLITGIVSPAKKGSTDAITLFQPNKDGSQRLALAVTVSDNYKSRVTDEERAAMSPEVAARRIDKDGKMYKSQRVSLTKFLPWDKAHGQPLNITMYKNLKPGDMVQVAYSVRSGSYTKDGTVTYTTQLEIESLQVIKHATVKEAAPAEAPVAGYVNDGSVFDAESAGADEPF